MRPFVPSQRGFHFDNAFPHGPAITIDLGVSTLPMGDAANGLCGGMVFAALDYWTADRPPPPDTAPPAHGTPLFCYLVRRLIDSWGLPTGPATYLRLMQPWYPDGDRQIGPVKVHGRAWRTAVREWRSVRADLDAGRPSPLGLVKVSSANPVDLGKNHQVLAYGYDLVDTAVTLRVYDPNQADNDTVIISFDAADPAAPIPFVMTPDVSAAAGVLCFFRVRYRPKSPPASARR
ncbi:MAG TPA: hypothetical protein VLL25_15920 [Acidimicrobiales bacterium]|nr:hypothetical protein [Acidimicrobiales bacterium]